MLIEIADIKGNKAWVEPDYVSLIKQAYNSENGEVDGMMIYSGAIGVHVSADSAEIVRLAITQ